jgi:small subunit ribosomal protein S6
MKEAHSLIHYETVFLLPGDAQPQKVDDFVEKVKALIVQKGGEVTLAEKWGRRRLAYPIGRQREGYYTFLQFNADPSFVSELNQFFRVSEDVIRQLICKALKGKPASPMMVLPPVAPHESHGPRSASHGPSAPGSPAAAAPASVTPASVTTASVTPASAASVSNPSPVPAEVSHVDSHSPRPA